MIRCCGISSDGQFCWKRHWAEQESEMLMSVWKVKVDHTYSEAKIVQPLNEGLPNTEILSTNQVTRHQNPNRTHSFKVPSFSSRAARLRSCSVARQSILRPTPQIPDIPPKLFRYDRTSMPLFKLLKGLGRDHSAKNSGELLRGQEDSPKDDASAPALPRTLPTGILIFSLSNGFLCQSDC